MGVKVMLEKALSEAISQCNDTDESSQGVSFQPGGGGDAGGTYPDAVRRRRAGRSGSADSAPGLRHPQRSLRLFTEPLDSGPRGEVGKHAEGGSAIDPDAAGRLDRRDAKSQCSGLSNFRRAGSPQRLQSILSESPGASEPQLAVLATFFFPTVFLNRHA